MEKKESKSLVLAHVQERAPLTKGFLAKETWHVTLKLNGAHLDFQPGDSLAIYPQNDPVLVSHLIEAMHASADTLIYNKRAEKSMTLEYFLTHHANLSRCASSFLQLIHDSAAAPAPKKALEFLLQKENKLPLKEFLSAHDPLSLLKDYADHPPPVQQLSEHFGPLLPRFYSIASSKHAHKDAVDLTVALFTWEQSGEKRYGVASHFLCHLATPLTTPIPLYLQPAHHFRLPQNLHAPIIMVGPGTGVAPFRAFMQERVLLGSKGKSWLFFGERNRLSNFFYEDFWQDLHRSHSFKLDTAFSRDQPEKIYVQHKMLEEARNLYSWIEEGAHFYVCGDAKEMAKDVEKTFFQILCQEGALSDEKALEKLRQLKKEKRYLTDVY